MKTPHPAPLLVIGALCAASHAFAQDSAQPKPSPYVPAGYSLVWNDEFSGPKLDTTKWGFPSYKVRENALMNTPGTVVLNGEGHLVLTTLFQDGQVHCSYVQTRGKFEPKFGYFESRIRFHRHQGHHGCFWLQTKTFGKPADDPANAGTEMDIIEWFGAGRTQGWAGMNIYYGGKDGNKVRSPSIPDFSLMGGPPPDGKKPSAPLGDLSRDFRTYGLLWTAEKCEFFCDGVKIMEDTKSVSQIPEFIVLSLLSSAWERPRLDTSKLPDSMAVDYVRVYAPSAKAP